MRRAGRGPWGGKHACLHGIIGAEFFHWLKHTDAGRRAKLEATSANTVMRPDPSDGRLALEPLPLPSTTHRDPAGEAQRGWSWRDVQAAV